MYNRNILTVIGFILLTTALLLGSPFEFLNTTAETIATYFIALLVLLLFTFLYKQIKEIDNKVYKRLNLVLLIILGIPYFLLGIWIVFFYSFGSHPVYQDLKVYTNEGGEKIISEWRRTSGSIYDYRSRKIYADYG